MWPFSRPSQRYETPPPVTAIAPAFSLTEPAWRVLNGIRDPHLPDDLEQMSHDELQIFFKECARLSKDETLQRVINILTKEQAQHILKNIETELDLLCTRASILGINQIFRRINTYAARCDEIPEKFDKFAAL